MQSADDILYGYVDPRVEDPQVPHLAQVQPLCGYKPLIPRMTGKRINLLERLMQSHYSDAEPGGAYIETKVVEDGKYLRLQSELILKVPGGMEKKLMRATERLAGAAASDSVLEQLHTAQMKEIKQALITVVEEEDMFSDQTAERELRRYVSGIHW